MYYLCKRTYLIKFKHNGVHKDVGPYNLKTIEAEENYIKRLKTFNRHLEPYLVELLESLQRIRIGGRKK